MKIVERVLKMYPQTRSSDRLLILKVWEMQGFGASETQKKFLLTKATSTESIRRTRQKFQQHGKYEASEEVDELVMEGIEYFKQSFKQELIAEAIFGFFVLVIINQVIVRFINI